MPISTIAQRAGPGARLGDPRRRRRRRLPRRARGRRGDGPVNARRLHARRRGRRRLRRLYAEYRLLHDYFGRGGNDVMKRLQALATRGARMTALRRRRSRQRSPRPARTVCRAARRAVALRPRRLDRRQRLGARARRRPVRDQAVRGVATTTSRRRPMIVCDLDGNVVARHAGQRALARRATPPRTPTSTGTCRRSAASCTPTPPTPRPGRRAARRSRA